jgi:hypothetical protein
VVAKTWKAQMTPRYFPARKNWVLYVPGYLTESRKSERRFFSTLEEAEKAAYEIEFRGSTARVKIDKTSEAVLEYADLHGLSKEEHFEAIQFYKKMVKSVTKQATLEEAAHAYTQHHEHEQSNWRTISKYNSTLDRLCGKLNPNMPMVELTEDKILNVYLKDFKPGVTRLSQYRNIHAFVVWAHRNGYLPSNPLEKTKPTDRWESNKEILKVEHFRRILFLSAEKFPRLLPFFVLGGFAGLRRCEMISSQPASKDPRIEWTDIDWKKDKIKIRQDVAKETLADDRRRSIPLEPAAKEWLQLIAKTDGPVMEISQSTLQREKEALLDMLRIKVPDNALRNSYASYAASFRGLGDVARAMGDLESTIKRFYVDLVDDPELGRAWFAIQPDSERKIVPMVA